MAAILKYGLLMATGIQALPSPVNSTVLTPVGYGSFQDKAMEGLGIDN